MADPVINFPKPIAGVAGDADQAGVEGIKGHASGFLGLKDPQFNQAAGVYGQSDQQGVMGLTTVPKGTGVYGGGTTAAGGDQIGVRGETVTNVGVFGRSFGSGAGVRGESAKNGVVGQTSSATDAGVNGRNDGNGFGVFGGSLGGSGVEGHSTNGTGVVGFSEHGLAGRFIGDVEVTGDIRFVKGDLAEEFPVATADLSTVEPGTVMVLNAEGTLQHSERPYDRRVAGVVSGAGGYKSAIVLDKQSSQEKRMPIALVGKTYCKADAQYGSIEVGDLLTTSPTPGHAMKAGDPARAFGAVIGKALRPLEQGQGLVPILIALQ